MGRRCDSALLCPGEELVYEVSWLNISLGQIRLKTVESTIVDGQVQHNAIGYVDSYDGLPFVDLHAIDHTQMDDTLYSRGFSAIEKKGDRWQSDKSRYEPSSKLLIIEKAAHQGKRSPPLATPTVDTVKLHAFPVQDGLSIFYFARASIRRVLSLSGNPGKRALHVPTVVYGKEGTTHLRIQKKTEYENIGAWKDKKIRVIPVEGTADFEGLYGFTGDFKGWFSDDPATIPIKAELKVIIGSVRLELIKWKREGWIPPE
jgi:hypothetical protein